MLEKEDDEENKDKFEWTLAKYALLFELSIVFFINFASFSILSTFFPNEATNIGATKSEIGFIFGAYPLVAFPASLIYGILIPKFGAVKLLLVGIFTNGITVFLFAFVNLISSSRLFVGACLILRILAALGGAACETTVRAILLTDFGSEFGFTMGVITTATVLSFTIGPLLGGALYNVGGFKLPFLVVGSVSMLMLFIVFISIPQKDYRGTKETPMQTLTKALCIPGVSMMVLTITILLNGLSVIDPYLAPHVTSIQPNISAATVGLIFLLNGVPVIVLSPLVGWICDKTGINEIVLTSGLVVGGISLLLIGPAPFLTSFLSKKIWMVCIAMVISGASTALTLPPSLTVMTMYASGAGMPDDLATNGILSGISNAAINLGAFTGPVVGGFFVEWLGFGWCAAIFGLVTVFQAVAIGVFTYFCRAPKPNGGENYSKVESDE